MDEDESPLKVESPGNAMQIDQIDENEVARDDAASLNSNQILSHSDISENMFDFEAAEKEK